MKVLFLMRHPGYVRNFESVLSELARRGHDVHLAFERQKLRWLADADPLEGLARHSDRITFIPAPRLGRTGWRKLATGVRACDDYLRYRQPEYANASKLRDRAERRLSPLPRRLVTLPGVPVSRTKGVLRAIERAVPVDPTLRKFIGEVAPDIVLVTPLVGLGSAQADYLKAARALGLPTGLCVASWDNLTNKGLIREHPDLVGVWNDAQRREAAELHDTPPDRIAVTGAHSYDHWFEWRSETPREQFCARVGLDPARPYILYLCSSPFIAPDEHPHVVRWLRQLRRRPEGELRDIGVLIRPHPQNADQWADADLSAFENVTVHPTAGADPVDVQRKAEYHDSIHHAALVVGVNTSAQIESAIMGRSVFTLLSPEFEDTQRGTLHFEHLAADEGGLLSLAESFEEHARQLATALRDPAAGAERGRAFVERFVRPFGLDEPGAPRMAAAIETTVERGARPAPSPGGLLTLLLRPVAYVLSGHKRTRRLLRRRVSRAARRASKRLRATLRHVIAGKRRLRPLIGALRPARNGPTAPEQVAQSRCRSTVPQRAADAPATEGAPSSTAELDDIQGHPATESRA